MIRPALIAALAAAALAACTGEPTQTEPTSPVEAATPSYTCRLHPTMDEPEPGDCPVCG